MYRLAPSPIISPLAGITGHIGVGHAFSHSGFIQEDSVGFACLLGVLAMTHSMDFTIGHVEVTKDTVSVFTRQGGCGKASARHGFTPFEADIMQGAVSRLCLAPQTLATQLFGRMYGQGAAEPASTFSLAIAKAYLNTVQNYWPEQCIHTLEDITGCCGEFLGGTLAIDDLPIAWLLSVNAADGGIGPIEDGEGTIPVGNKGVLMEKIGMHTAPTLILESKAFIPSMKKDICNATFFARWNEAHDNPVVGKCLTEALIQSGLPYQMQDDAYPRNSQLAEETARIGKQIMQLGEQYAQTPTASTKVALAGELARIVSRDLGASIFMSDAIYRYASGGGLWPGHGAVLSLLATREYADEVGSMIVTEQELQQMGAIALRALNLVAQQHDAAQAYVLARRPALTPQQVLDMTQAPRQEQ